MTIMPKNRASTEKRVACPEEGLPIAEGVLDGEGAAAQWVVVTRPMEHTDLNNEEIAGLEQSLLRL